MFGISLWKILAVLALIGAAVGYFKYTQDELARLNQEVATKDFALKTTTETLKKTQDDLKAQQEKDQNYLIKSWKSRKSCSNRCWTFDR